MVFSPSRTQTRGLEQVGQMEGFFRGLEKWDLLKVFLIRLIITVRVSNLLEKVFLLIDDVVTDTSQVSIPIHSVSPNPRVPITRHRELTGGQYLS